MKPEADKFQRMQEADEHAERLILRGEIGVLLVLGLVAMLYYSLST